MIPKVFVYVRPTHTLISDYTTGVRIEKRIPHEYKGQHSPKPLCRYLGCKASMDIKVKCGSENTKVDCYTCYVIKHRRLSNGKPGLCLPDYRPVGRELIAWNKRPESTLVHLCLGCELLEETGT